MEQEPQLDDAKDVRGNVEEGVAEIKALLTEFDEISMKFGEEMTDDEMNDLLMRQGDLQNQIDAVGGWELDRTLERAADALRLPPGTPRSPTCPAVSDVVLPCAGYCCPSPICCCWTNPPTTWMPNLLVG